MGLRHWQASSFPTHTAWEQSNRVWKLQLRYDNGTCTLSFNMSLSPSHLHAFTLLSSSVDISSIPRAPFSLFPLSSLFPLHPQPSFLPSPSYLVLPSLLSLLSLLPFFVSPFLSFQALKKGARCSSCKNATTTAGKDRVVLKEKLQDIERKVCLVSVERQLQCSVLCYYDLYNVSMHYIIIMSSFYITIMHYIIMTS